MIRILSSSLFAVALVCSGLAAHAETVNHDDVFSVDDGQAYASEESEALSDDQGMIEGFRPGQGDRRPGRPGDMRPGRPGGPDRRPGGPDHRPGRGGPGWNHGPGWGRGPRAVSCVARDGRGQSFVARGFGNPGSVQRDAVNQCRRFSGAAASCRPVGCR